MAPDTAADTAPDKLFVAREILAQLGGNKFLAMTGMTGDQRPVGCAGGTADDPHPWLKLRLPSIAQHGHTHLIITLINDLYKLEFFRHTLEQYGEKQDLMEYCGVYGDDLQTTFTEVTGLDTHL